MDARLSEQFLADLMMEDQEELEAVEEPRLTQDFLMEDHEEEEAVEEVSLEDGLVYLFARFTELREEFPAEDCSWYDLDPEERTELALEKVEEVFHRVLQRGERTLEYPTLSNWDNVQFTPGYGLQPLEDSQVSLRKFLHILDVMRTLLQSTKRDIYYQHVRDFGSQREVDRLVSIAVAMLEVSPAQ